MGFRIRKSIKLFPGVRINLSKSGVSASVGVKGTTVNISEKGTRATVDIPGTGVSYSEKLAPNRRLMTPAPAKSPRKGTSAATVLGWVFVVVCFCVVLSRLTG